MQSDKAAARRHFLQLRRTLPVDERARAEHAIQEYLAGVMAQAWSTRQDVGTAGLFAAIRGEPEVAPAAAAWRALGGLVAYPRVEGPRQMAFHRVADEWELTPGAFHILEPPADAPVVPPAQLSILVIPAVAYTQSGYRLGYGGGYYDTYLAQPGVRALRVGVAFSVQVTASAAWPVDPFDQPVDILITEDGVVGCSRARSS
ncbi:MAG: 5-formyltetrahydrofolate cyclo-ligase [Alicyclobacillus shizuokensis]|nr:5-formyltetrahydrofolate cyclo-ligase [Alicyclobacillus shizuokensis]